MIHGTVHTGAAIIDELIGGGLESDVITTVYGPAGSGKSNFAMIATVHMCRMGKRVVYIDTEGSFSYARFVQLTSEEEAKRLVEQIVFLKPVSFQEQKDTFARLPEIKFDDIGLIVVDSIAMLYRLEMGRVEDVSEVNRQLSIQVGTLTKIARSHNIPVVITNQVYSNFDERDKVSMVGGDILKYGSKCLMEFQILGGKRKAVLMKHRSQPQGKFAVFEIKETGFFASEEPVSVSVDPPHRYL